MGLLKPKGKEKTPYRHIGMALVPPAAFTAVPDSPPPTPLPKYSKKVVASPVIPCMLGATATVRAIGLGNAGTDIQRMRIDYSRVTKGKAPLESDELFASITVEPESAGPSHLREHGEIHQEPVYAIPYKTRSKEVVPRSSSASPERSRVKVHARKMYGRSPEPRKSLEERRKSSKRTRSESPIRTPESHSPVRFEEEDSPVLYRKQEDLEERMRLQEEQNREMIFSMIKEASSQKPLASPSDDYFHPEGSPPISSKTDRQLLQEIAELLKGQSLVGAEGVVLKQQIQELIDENEILKETVERLNLELSKFQEKFGASSDVENSRGALSAVDRPKWLTNVKFLSPLFASYDQQLNAKDDFITRHEQQFSELSTQMEEVLRENEILRKATEKTRADPFVSQQRWTNMKEQRELMVEEIQVQLQQLELMEKKAKQMHVSHVEEVAKLSQLLVLTDTEYQEAEKERKECKKKLADLSEKHEELVLEAKKKIPPEDFARALKQCQGDIEDLKDQHVKEMKEALIKVKETQKEKSEALLTGSEIHTLNLQLQGEVEALKEKQTTLRQEIENLRSDLNESEERELECQLHLANAVKVAEQASSERATYAAVAEKEQIASDHAKRRSMREQWEMGRMEESLKHYKLQLASQHQDVTERIREVEESHAGQLLQYERKMAHLQKLLVQKQRALDDMAADKKEVENRLESVWQSASMENKLLMETLSRSKIHTR